MKNKHRFAVGDIIVYTEGPTPVKCQIVSLTDTGYRWKYLFSEKIFWSADSNDPWFECWELVETVK